MDTIESASDPGTILARRTSARDAWHAGALLCATLLLWAPRLCGPLDLRWDGAVYYVLGTSLAEGKGYRLLNEPGEIEAVQYPPLLPLIVAAHQKLLGTSDTVRVGSLLRVSFLLMNMAYVVAAYVLARRFLAPSLALAAGAITALHLNTFFLSDLCFAELPFALVSTLFLLCYRKHPALAALCGAMGYLLRSAGAALLGAWVVEALLRARYRQAALRAVLAFVPVLLWQWHVRSVTTGAEYARPAYAYQRAPYQFYNVTYAQNMALVDPFRPELGTASFVNTSRRVLASGLRLIPRLGEAVLTPARPWAYVLWLLSSSLAPRLPTIAFLAATSLLGGFTLLGLALLVRRGELLAPLYVLGTAGLIALTPWPEQVSRYWAPLLPVLALALAQSASSAMRASEGCCGLRRAGRLLAPGMLGSVLAIQLATVLYMYSQFHPVALQADSRGTHALARVFFYGSEWRSFDESLDWLRAHAGQSAVLATSAPQQAYLRTGLKAVMPPMEIDSAKAQRLLDAVPVRYLIIDHLASLDATRRYGVPVVERFPELWALVYSRGVRIYERQN
jgi:hypothetical protein